MPLAMMVRRTSKSTFQATAEERRVQVNTISQPVFDEHPLSVAGDERLEGAREIVRQQNGRFVMAQVPDQELPQCFGT